MDALYECMFIIIETKALNRFKERKRKPETNKILIGTEPEPETK